ncbi:MAG: cytochrome C [Sphingobacteriales bacterium]|nr:MAG: cytochrome C [Sphingobacteriales bacterium]
MKKILLILLLLLIAIQFIRPARNNAESKPNTDITMAYNVPLNVQQIMDKACRDCHSDYTNYPWYDKIQPVAWWMDHHVEEGKQELNFSQFASYSGKKKAHKLEEIVEQVEQNEMPLNSYTWMHKDAKLTEAEKVDLVNWAKALRQQIIMQERVL